MVVLGLTPLRIGIEPVVGSPALILVFQTLLRFFFTFAVFGNNALCPEFHIRMYKYIEAICSVLEDIIRTAAYDNTGAFFRKVDNNLPLDRPELILIGGAHRTVCQEGRKPSGTRIFSGFFDVFRGESAFVSNLLDQLGVIARNSKLFSSSSSDGSSAAAKFAADGNNPVAHFIPSH